jgi:hypothetical protein
MDDTDRIGAAILAAGICHRKPVEEYFKVYDQCLDEFRARAAKAASFTWQRSVTEVSPPANTELGAAVKRIYNRHRP